MLDGARHLVTLAGTPVDLTPREFEILRVLLTHQGRLVTKGRLLRAVWGEAYQGEAGYVYVYVSQLRRKLAAADPDGILRDLIVTEPGVGYRVAAPDEDPRLLPRDASRWLLDAGPREGGALHELPSQEEEQDDDRARSPARTRPARGRTGRGSC